MLTPQELVEAFARNTMVVKMQSQGLSQADSLLQLPFRGNCLNWVVGHIVDSRDEVLDLLGEPRVLEPAVTERYRRTSDPVAQDGPGVLDLGALLERLELAQQRISAALERASAADLAREVQVGERTATVAQRVFFRYFHETYHVGQTELLRQLAGVNDALI